MTLLGDDNMLCPRCDKEWWEGDYFELRVGCEVECPHCGAKIRITAPQGSYVIMV